MNSKPAARALLVLELCISLALFVTHPEETEHGTRPGGRGPGGVPGGVGSKNRGGMGAYIKGSLSVYRGGSVPIAILPVCLFVCASYSKLYFLYRCYLNLLEGI